MLPGGGGGDPWRMVPMDCAPPGGATPPSSISAPFPNHQQAFFPAMWTAEENRVFEAALVDLCGAAEDERFRCIAARIPGKTPEDVREHYRRLESDLMNIEAGIIELPEFAAAAAAAGGGGKAKKTEERKKGIPWTEEEHRRFLEGLEKYGKGDWRSISRNSVVTRTPTQVASHAQKYFLRQSMEGKKDRRRSSIHDVTRA